MTATGEMEVEFDHLVIGAADLEAGAAWSQATFRAEAPIGGAHPMMGTHNRLARLPVGYLEIIAIDPGAPRPARRRWYGLDDPATQARIADRPRPIGWVLAVPDLDAAAAAAGWEVGRLIDAARGDLTWRMAVREDGGVAEGVLPLLIEWPERLGKRAPTDRMAELGLALRELKLRHPDPEWLRDMLASVAAEDAAARAGFALTIGQSPERAIEATFMSSRIKLSL